LRSAFLTNWRFFVPFSPDGTISFLASFIYGESVTPVSHDPLVELYTSVHFSFSVLYFILLLFFIFYFRVFIPF